MKFTDLRYLYSILCPFQTLIFSYRCLLCCWVIFVLCFTIYRLKVDKHSLFCYQTIYDVCSKSNGTVPIVTVLNYAEWSRLAQIDLSLCRAYTLSFNVLTKAVSLQQSFEGECAECDRLNAPQVFHQWSWLVQPFEAKNSQESFTSYIYLYNIKIITLFESQWWTNERREHKKENLIKTEKN